MGAPTSCDDPTTLLLKRCRASALSAALALVGAGCESDLGLDPDRVDGAGVDGRLALAERIRALGFDYVGLLRGYGDPDDEAGVRCESASDPLACEQQIMDALDDWELCTGIGRP